MVFHEQESAVMMAAGRLFVQPKTRGAIRTGIFTCLPWPVQYRGPIDVLKTQVTMATYRKIVVLETEVQAQLLDSLLAEQGIPHRMRSYHDSALDGIFQGPKGWGHVEAPEEYRQEILESLAALARQPWDPERDDESGPV
jgi:hypothetical protein